MSELLEAEDNFWSSITVPSDGDAFVRASDLKPAFQALLDNTFHAKTKVDEIATAVLLPSGNITRSLAPVGPHTTSMGPRSKSAQFVPDSRLWNGSENLEMWSFNNGRLRLTRPTVDNTYNDSWGLLWSINHLLVDGGTLAGVDARVKGSIGHAALPATQMSIGIFRVPTLSFATMQSLIAAGDWVADAQGTLAAYKAAHTFTATCDANNVIDKANFNYFIQFWDGFGANAVGENELYGFALRMTNCPRIVP